MTFVNFLIGLPVMLLCLIVQVAVSFWCVRYYVSRSPGSGQGLLAIVMSRERRLLGPLVAVNGMLMLGMSAATLMAIVQHLITLLRGAGTDAGSGGRG